MIAAKLRSTVRRLSTADVLPIPHAAATPDTLSRQTGCRVTPSSSTTRVTPTATASLPEASAETTNAHARPDSTTTRRHVTSASGGCLATFATRTTTAPASSMTPSALRGCAHARKTAWRHLGTVERSRVLRVMTFVTLQSLRWEYFCLAALSPSTLSWSYGWPATSSTSRGLLHRNLRGFDGPR